MARFYKIEDGTKRDVVINTDRIISIHKFNTGFVINLENDSKFIINEGSYNLLVDYLSAHNPK
jgi:hypothetical protein